MSSRRKEKEKKKEKVISHPSSSSSSFSSSLTNLPQEMVYEYMLRLGASDLQNACRTSKRHAEICRDNNFWIAKIKVDFPDIIGHYDKTNAKKAWIHCTVGLRFVFNIYISHALYYNDAAIGSFMNKFPEDDEEALKYIYDLVREEAIERIQDRYLSLSQYFSSTKCINLSNSMIYYIKDGRFCIYLRRRRNGKSQLLKLSQNKIELIHDAIGRYNALLISLRDIEIKRRKSVKAFQDKTLEYYHDGNLVTTSLVKFPYYNILMSSIPLITDRTYDIVSYSVKPKLDEEELQAILDKIEEEEGEEDQDPVFEEEEEGEGEEEEEDLE